MVLPDRDRLRAAFLRGKGAARAGDAGAAGPGETQASAGTRPGAVEDLRAMLQRRLSERRASQRPVELPPGEEVQNDAGICWHRILRYPFDHEHGRQALAPALRLDGTRLSTLAKNESFAALDPRRCLFLDTETTGLSGGAGTVVFVVGLGWFETDAFVLEQFFLRDFGEEPAMLRAVAHRLAERPIPVSYVGKSFDRHRIAARLAVHRLAAPILTDEHLDLYYVARRAFGRELPNCRLRTVEERVLGLQREDDLPGSEAPVAFLQWIRDRSGPVDRVLEHNRLDVLSVAALLARVAGVPVAGE